MDLPNLKLASWWEPASNGKLLCTLCPRFCTIGEGQKGFCFVRENIGGKLYSTGYGRPTGFGIDPIEKKPLNHFYPGTEALSFGTAGCNLGCKFCQNWTMSKAKLDEIHSLKVSPEEVIALAKKHSIPSIAFTYNDPTIFGEYVIDIAKLAREENINTVMVTAGYITEHARNEIYKYIDAANVDLKSFSKTFYAKLTLSNLDNILTNLMWIRNETEIWLEITNLLIPEANDSGEEIKKMIDWILTNLGDDVPLHFTAFHPAFKMLDRESAPPGTIERARNIAMEMGMKYCYTGNIHSKNGNTTFCPSCGVTLIQRQWHSVITNNIINNRCAKCGTEISGIFN